MRGVVASALLLVAALAAGCLEQPASVEPEPEAEPEEPGRVARTGRDRGEDGEEQRSGNVTLRGFRDTFGLTLTSANAALRLGSIQGYNCVSVTGAPFTILNGTATLTWTADTAMAESLELTARTYYNDFEETASGQSPLVLEFGEIEVEDDDYYDTVDFGVQLGSLAGVAYEQQVDLVLEFEYESDVDVGTVATYC